MADRPTPRPARIEYDMTALSRKRLIDKLLEAYVDWREPCVRVDDA
jgi:hypothetical protein